jgi:hypothetical protein
MRDNLIIETAQKAYMNFTKLDSGRIDTSSPATTPASST